MSTPTRGPSIWGNSIGIAGTMPRNDLAYRQHNPSRSSRWGDSSNSKSVSYWTAKHQHVRYIRSSKTAYLRPRHSTDSSFKKSPLSYYSLTPRTPLATSSMSTFRW